MGISLGQALCPIPLFNVPVLPVHELRVMTYCSVNYVVSDNSGFFSDFIYKIIIICEILVGFSAST